MPEATVRRAVKAESLAPEAKAAADADHGHRRTNEDKRRAVLRLVNDAEWSRKPNTEIARLAGVSEFLVRSIRPDKQTAEPSSIKSKIPETRTVMRTGSAYEMRTGNIGQSRPAAPPPMVQRPPRPRKSAP